MTLIDSTTRYIYLLSNSFNFIHHRRASRGSQSSRYLRSRSSMAPSFSREDSDLIHELKKISRTNPKLIKGSEYEAPAAPEIILTSWKMTEHRYYDIPSPFPTLARGLFSTEIVKDGEKHTADNKRYRIVVRGYDKFFNIGEVPWTTWSSLEEHTCAPYTLSLKSNGCIIFIAALTPSKLVVTSKHSVGPVKDVPKSHSQVGEKWLHTHVEKSGKSLEDLAAVLWDKNWTAVAELCDDSFEEHVLPYPPEKSGLHLHGINENTKHFKTLSTEVVDKFAEDWGFIVTKTLVLKSIPEVREFTDEISKTGQWNGEALEGFVVRSHVTEPPTDGRRSANLSPYTPGSSFFFKVKFDEPYMMYRDWREVTKSLLSTKGFLEDVKIPKSKMKRPETKVYVDWVKKEIRKDRSKFENYSKGKGIIATRERFLEWLESDHGKIAQQSVEQAEDIKDKTFGKTVIVPVAIPGVGKTAVSIALAHLFDFGHTQSDDVHTKKPAPAFIKNVKNLLKDHNVVIADKNNHLRQHREQLREATKDIDPPVRLLAMNWAFDQPVTTIHRICSDRVLNRGENHQTLRADTSMKSHEDIIWQFIDNMQELAEAEVDATIEMEIGESLEQAVDRAVDGCVRILGLTKPDQEKVGEALAVARGYTPVKKKADDKKKPSTPRYYALLPEVDILQLLDHEFSGPEATEEGKSFWDTLKNYEQVIKRPHVTLVHSKSLPDNQELWDRCMSLHLMSNPPLYKFKLGSVVWDHRVMAITVDEIVADEDGPNKEGEDLVRNLPPDLVQRLHITVGTRNKDVNPFEARQLVEEWRKGGKVEGVGSLTLLDVYGKGRVSGLFS